MLLLGKILIENFIYAVYPSTVAKTTCIFKLDSFFHS